MSSTPALHLKKGRDRSVRRRHPWVFSGAVARVEGDPPPGSTVEVLSSDGEWLARGAYSPESQIRVRMWTWQVSETVGPDLLARRWREARQARRGWFSRAEVTAYREVHGESDGLPGLIVDRYGEFRVVQILSMSAEFWRDTWAELLQEDDIRGVMERSDADVRTLEGLPLRTGVLSGEIPPTPAEFSEYGLHYAADLRSGQKTGFYLDQRENRRLLRPVVAGAQVLDAFAYTGGFSVAALAGGAANVLAIESSEEALELGETNVRRNGGEPGRWEGRKADVFEELRRLRDRRQMFDVVILDPPRFAATSAQASRAARGYKDINLLAFKLLRPGGMLWTFSCSGGVGVELFQKIVAGAALDAGVDARVQAWLGQPADHPVSIAFPEGRYLKGLVCRVG